MIENNYQNLDSLDLLLNNRQSSNHLLLIIALWSGPDLFALDIAKRVSNNFSDIKFWIKTFDDYSEVNDILKKLELEKVFTPHWIFIKDGVLVKKIPGKIFSQAELISQIEELIIFSC